MTVSEHFLNDRACGVFLVCVVVSTYQKWSKEGQLVNRVKGTWDSLMYQFAKLSYLTEEKGVRKPVVNQCPCWPLTTPKSAYNKQVSTGTGPQSLVWLITFNYISGGLPDACVSLTWGRDGTRIHYEEKASQQKQCDAPGNVLLGKLGPCYFDMYHR